MWMTGLDVPSCSTLYLDKPMRNHTLMQTIARANRVYRDKVSGLIVDYVGVSGSPRPLGEGLEVRVPLPDPAVQDLRPSCVLIRVLAEKIRGLAPPADISGFMQQVEDLLDSSIAAEGYVIREPSEEYGTDHRIDLSGIDFEALKTRFEQGRKHTEAERVKGVVARQLRKMVRLNRTRMDYLERFQRMIDE